jgi:ribosomal RNA assembly protein
MPVLYARIPEDRLAVLIGTGGTTMREIEQQAGVSLHIDEDEGAVRIASPETGDPGAVLTGRDIVQAIGRGFSPRRAFRLLKPGTYLSVIDMKAVTRHRSNEAMRRLRSRIIGVNGRARERIEELSGCSVSVYGTTVAVIGDERQLDRATRAIILLLQGSEHSTIFRQLIHGRREDTYEDLTGPVRLPEEEL